MFMNLVIWVGGVEELEDCTEIDFSEDKLSGSMLPVSYLCSFDICFIVLGEIQGKPFVMSLQLYMRFSGTLMSSSWLTEFTFNMVLKGELLC